MAKGKHLAISHKHRPSGESRRSNNGTTNGKNGNGGREERDGLGLTKFGKKEGKNGKDCPPQFFTNGTTKTPTSASTLRKSWHGGTGGIGGVEGGGATDKDLLTPFLTPKRRSPILRQYSVNCLNDRNR